MNVGYCASVSTIQNTRKWPDIAAQYQTCVVVHKVTSSKWKSEKLTPFFSSVNHFLLKHKAIVRAVFSEV